MFDVPPKTAEAPYLVIGRAVEAPLGAQGGGCVVTLTVTAVSRFAGQEEARAVVAAMRDALEAFEVSDEGVKGVLRGRGAEVFSSSDGRGAYGVLRLRAVMEG